MSISKTRKSSFNIIRRADYTRKNMDTVSEVEISNKDSKLDNKSFNDLVFEQKENTKPKDHQNSDNSENKNKDSEQKNKDGLTDFYV